MWAEVDGAAGIRPLQSCVLGAVCMSHWRDAEEGRQDRGCGEEGCGEGR